jgi:hypothetical protein
MIRMRRNRCRLALLIAFAAAMLEWAGADPAGVEPAGRGG